jgi:hypothetical protein
MAYFLQKKYLSLYGTCRSIRCREFVGRSDELHAVKAKLFDRDDCPIISLLGLGGVGKSRSALELAHQTKSEYPAVFGVLGSGGEVIDIR